MAKILPFKGVLYNEKAVGNLEAVMSPPYDVISPRMQEELHRAHGNNIVRIILGKEKDKDTTNDNKYTRAACLLAEWLKKGVLKKDRRPSLYVYEQEYLHKGRLKKRIGFISLMRIEDPSSSLVLPHEYTFSKPKEDRLNLIRAAKANTSPIFCIYEDKGKKVMLLLRKYTAKKHPLIAVHLNGVGHRIWRMPEAGAVKRIQKALEDKQVFIADGHHRYEVALAFRDEMRKRFGRRRAGKFGNVMVYLSSLKDEGLTVFSTYRVIKNIGGMPWSRAAEKLGEYFLVEQVKDRNDMFRKLERAKKTYAFGVYFKNRRFYLLTLKDKAVLNKVIKVDKTREWKKLNVTVLHFLVFNHILRLDKNPKDEENIIYTQNEDHAVDLVKDKGCDIAFFQLPAKITQVQKIARSGDRMPHKSTYFYPKPLTGLVLHKF